MSQSRRRVARLFGRRSLAEARWTSSILQSETIGGGLLLVAAALAFTWANSPWSDSYRSLLSYRLGPSWLHLDLPLSQWASDGLLAIFFFVAGLELKRELVVGGLRDTRRAAVPVTAAVGGVIVPAVLYTLVNLPGGGLRGWAIPTATDIAFALAALAVIGRHLPPALRSFLLTLAVVDDLVAIVVIAVFYTRDLSVLPLMGALVALAMFAGLVRLGVRSPCLLLPVAVATWALVHASGVHATVAGVVLAFAVPVVAKQRHGGLQAGQRLAEHFEHHWRPISAGVAVPTFAFFSAGVSVNGLGGFGRALVDPVAVGIVIGLVVGKPVGIMAATYLVARFTRASLDQGLTWLEVFGIAILGGIGFTVSLLIGELAFGADSERYGHVKVAVLAGSLLAVLLASIVMRLPRRRHPRAEEASDPSGI